MSVSESFFQYWETRARQYATRGDGLRAVCSYGMPAFYNRLIEWTQTLAMRPWLRVATGASVLDVGCGIGRWSRAMARHGAHVTGVDLSPTMVEQARARSAGLSCTFETADVTRLELGKEFDQIVAVTVLQHLLEEGQLDAALANLARHLKSGGRMVLLEAAPSWRTSWCNTAVFRARSERDYRDAFARAGLRLLTVTGVDPGVLKTFFLPWYRKLPRPVANTILALLTALSAPVDLLLGRVWRGASWHKVFVLERA